MAQRTVRLQSMVNANGRLYGDITEWPDDEATWTRVALGVLRVPDEPDGDDVDGNVDGNVDDDVDQPWWSSPGAADGVVLP